MADKGSQTEKPTQRRLEKARKEGNFPVSKEFVNGVQFLVFLALLASYGGEWLANLTSTSRLILARSFHVELTPAALRELLYLMTTRLVFPLALAGAALVAVSLATHLAVTRLGFSFDKLAPDLKRFNPAKTLGNLKSQNPMQLLQALVLLPIFSMAVCFIARDNLSLYLQLPFQTVESGLKRIAASTGDLLWKAAYVFLIWGSIDLFRQQRRFQKEMKMSKQDIRDESKESDGNPQIKQKIRRLQRDALRRRMMTQVPTATAVIVNPTHFAVAIRYHVESMATPVVVAKGKNYLALRIRQIATENMVPIVENPPLAQALYKSVEVGQEIPANFYRAIAEILAYIYKLRGNDSMPQALVQAPKLRAAGLQDIGVPVAVLAIVLVMIVPVPPILLDVLISANIMLSVVVLLVSLYIKRAVEFSVFPTTLLLLTLFRLALNISSSRSILLNGATGTSAAGQVIEAFGNFVVGGNYVIGVVIFLVLLAIQFVVINHGAVRISEVTARFTLDAMPGKQVAIDSDLNAGLIDKNEARNRRKQISGEAEFYGAMDGATRFTQRDAIASILITVINIVAGFLIGVFQHGMDLQKALATYTVLTIGDGLVTVIPALVISVSGGLIVTRSNSESGLAETLRTQLFQDSQPLLLASGIMLALAVMPGMPRIPFLFMASGVGYAGWRIRQKNNAVEQAVTVEPKAQVKDSIESLLKVEPLAVEVGLGLVAMVEGGQNSTLLRRIASIRKQLAGELGYMLPAVRVTDNLALGPREYAVRLKGVEIARFELKQGCELAIRPSSETGAPQLIEGPPTMEPAFGIPAIWVRSEQAEAARSAGYTVVDPSNIVGTHLMEIIRRHAHELFSRQDAKKLLDRVAEENPKLVEDLVPKLLSLALLQRVLQNLLRERVSIRDAVTIFEALGDAAIITRNPVLLTEFVRQALGRAIVQPYLGIQGELPAFFLDSSVEQAIESSIEHGEHASQVNLAPQKIREILERVNKRLQNLDGPVAIVASTGARYFLRQLVEPSFKNVFVLSHSEIPPGTKVSSLGLI